MRILVYKRTHSGDPDTAGRFGVYDCMGSVRGKAYDAVIGVGGTGPEPRRNGIAGKITWVGIGPRKEPGTPRGPLVTFDHFLYFGEGGPPLTKYAPTLADHMYGSNVRVLINLTAEERREAEAILAMAEPAPPSEARKAATKRSDRVCRSEASPQPSRSTDPSSCRS